MSGLLRRLTRRRPATADENRSSATATSEPIAAPAETPAEPGGQRPVPDSVPAEPRAEPSGRQSAAGEQPTVVLPATAEYAAATDQPATTRQAAAPAQPLPAWTVAADQPTAFAAQPARDLPAGVDPADLATAPASARRGKLRRRLRYLRHVRELLLRDLGGFTYEVHRTAGGTAEEPQRRLATAKAQRISALDAEVRALEIRLGEPHGETVLREPGIGGTCPECGELHASDAHFCARCGAPLDEKSRAKRAAEQPTTGSHGVVEPQPASVLWAGGPRPAPKPSPAGEEAEAEPPSSVTSQWLATDQPTTFSRAAQPDEPSKDEPSKPEAATTPAEPAATTPADPPDEAGPPAPATASAHAKPKRAPAKPRAAKPARRAPAPRAEEPKPADPDEPTPASDAPDEPPRSFEANGRSDEDVPPPVSPGDPLASPREQGQ